MGSWSVYCGLSNISIVSGNDCVLLPLKNETFSEGPCSAIYALPIFGKYNDYGGIENIVEDDHTKFIEDHLGITIDEFCIFLVDGKFTYERDEAKAIQKKLEANGRYDEVKNVRFMWIDKQVYDLMSVSRDNFDKGVHDFGTKKALALLGFEFVEEREDNPVYDPKRYKEIWKKNDAIVYADGYGSILSSTGRLIYRIGRTCESSLETYFTVPSELDYLKTMTRTEAWRLMEDKEAKEALGYIFGLRYEFDIESLNSLIEEHQLKDSEFMAKREGRLAKIEKERPFNRKLIMNLETYGDRIVNLINIRNNAHSMSGYFTPFVLYATPQCGEYKNHQRLLEEFVRINKGYAVRYGDDDDDDDE